MNHNIKTFFRNLMLLMALTSLPLSVMAQTKRALLIGLGEQKDVKWDKINGDKDIPYVKEMLKASGYKQDNMKTLINKQATKKGILDAFKSLTDRCRKGDIVYIHFSGHGQQMTDIDGDEPEGLDESWIPYDAYRKPCKKDRQWKNPCGSRCMSQR